MFKLAVVFAAVLCVLVEAQPLIQKQKLRFKLSARGLPDKDNLGTTDPYVILYYTENGSDKQYKVGRTGTITDNENPSWGDIMEFDYDRSKGQRWYFKVYDHDNAREDDTVGKAWVIVDDYVDKGQRYTVNLHKKGTLTVESSEPVPIAPVSQGQPQLVQPAPVAVQPLPPTTNGQQQVVPPVAVYQQVQPQRLRIQLAARGLPDLDVIGTTDPYVKAFYTDDTRAAETPFGRTVPIENSENPDFKELLEFDYVRGKHQRWHFVILDQDENRRDDEAGEAFVDVDEYVSKGENLVVPLKKGQLIIKRA